MTGQLFSFQIPGIPSPRVGPLMAAAFDLFLKHRGTVNLFIFAGGKFCKNVGKIYVGVIFTVLTPISLVKIFAWV